MLIWRLKHLPTGLYFKPSKHRNKSNLSKKGKLYHIRPTVRWLDGYYYHPDDLPRHSVGYCPTRRVIESEWVAEEVKNTH